MPAHSIRVPGPLLAPFLASANNPWSSGIELAEDGERIHISAVELNRLLEFVAHLFRQSVGLNGIYAAGFFAISPAQPEVISAIGRPKPDRDFALANRIVLSLFLVVHAAKQIVRLRPPLEISEH